MGRLKDLVTSIEKFIPGLSGYKQKELLREEDLAVRQYIVKVLGESLNDLRQAEQYAIMTSQIDPTFFEQMVVQNLEGIIRRIESAEAGYGGLFDQITVEEPTLENLLENDKNLLEKVTAFRDTAKSEVNKVMSGQPLDIQSLASAVNEIKTLIENRDKILKGGE